MWNDHFLLPQGRVAYGQQRMSKSAPCSPMKPLVKRTPARADSFHVIHKVPVGDTPYVKAKHVQLVDKDPDRAIALFWAAINAGDRVDSALKDMAIVMKQQNRPEEAIEAIKSLRCRCSDQAQESLDNVLLDLYKRCGRLDDQIALLKHKLHLIHQGLAFNGRRTKTARSQGKKFQVSIEQEATRLLGNLGWAYMQQSNYVAAEAVYRKALSIEPDNNKVCNLGICLMKQGRLKEARAMLKSVKPACADSPWGLDSHLKSYERAQEMLRELESSMGGAFNNQGCLPDNLEPSSSLWQSKPCCSWRSNLNSLTDSDISGALFATSGFGPVQKPPLHPQQHGFSAAAAAHSDQNPQLSTYSNSSSWEEDVAEDGFADENSRKNEDQQVSPINWHAEALRQRLEKMSMKGGGDNGKLEPPLPPPPPSSSHSESVLNSAALPFIIIASQGGGSYESRSTANNSNSNSSNRNAEERRMPLTVDSTNQLPHNSNVLGVSKNTKGLHNCAAVSHRRRSLSLESFDPSLLPLENCTMMMPKPSSPAPAAPKKLSLASGGGGSNALGFSSRNENVANPSSPPPPNRRATKSCCKSLFSSAKNSSIGTEDPWSSLGFIQSPEGLESLVGSAIAEADFGGVMAAAEQQQALQRRLRVFEEMTLPHSPTPQAAAS